jgi:hypothetical protein
MPEARPNVLKRIKTAWTNGAKWVGKFLYLCGLLGHDFVFVYVDKDGDVSSAATSGFEQWKNDEGEGGMMALVRRRFERTRNAATVPLSSFQPFFKATSKEQLRQLLCALDWSKLRSMKKHNQLPERLQMLLVKRMPLGNGRKTGTDFDTVMDIHSWTDDSKGEAHPSSSGASLFHTRLIPKTSTLHPKLYTLNSTP